PQQDQVVEVRLGQTVDNRAKMNLLPAETGKAVFASCHLVPSNHDEIEQLANGNGYNREINAAPAHDEQPEQCCGGTANERADKNRKRSRGRKIFQRPARAVRTKPKICRLPE